VHLAKLFQPTVLSKACPSCICYSSLDQVLGFFLRHPINSKLLYSIVLHFTIPKAVIIEVSAKKFFSFPYPAPDTILKLLQSPETQGIKYKKKTITTFRILSTLFCPKSFQNPTDYASLSCLFPINDVSPSLFPFRIFFTLCWSSLCYWLVILNSLVICQVLVSFNHSPKSLSHVLDVIYLNITNLILSMLICNQQPICLSPLLVYCWF